MPTATTTVDRIVDSIKDNNDTMMDVVRAANERMYRANRIAMDEVQRTQEETFELARTWLSAPTDVSGFNSAVFNTLTRRIRRRVEIGRTLVDDLRDFGAGTRSIWERMTESNREVAQTAARATVRVGKTAASRVAEEASEIVERAGEAAERASDAVENTVENVSETVSDTLDDAAKDLRRQARDIDSDPSRN